VDLGTTNSAACVFDGEQVIAIRGSSGETLTPSVVRIDARSNLTVGARAYRLLQKDPDNTRGEFKRLMGARHRYAFAAAKLEKSPEELAAAVLGSLRDDVEAQLGVRPEQAVIGVPALFELPQIQATSEAARLAGFTRIETIQEPVASALASGWSADECRGSGSSTISEAERSTRRCSRAKKAAPRDRTRRRQLPRWSRLRSRHRRLVDRENFGGDGVKILRSNPSHARAVATLKAQAEEAKIELGRAKARCGSRLEGLDVDGARVRFPRAIAVESRLEAIAAPLVDSLDSRVRTVCSRRTA
jgi:molecular chaperone DnaK